MNQSVKKANDPDTIIWNKLYFGDFKLGESLCTFLSFNFSKLNIYVSLSLNQDWD